MSEQNFSIKGDDYYKLLKKGSVGYKGLLFCGEEDYMKANTLRLLKETVCPDEAFRDMNIFSFDSLDYSPASLSDAFSSSPVFAEEKLVIQSGLDIDAMRESDFSALLSAVESMDEYDGNVFVLCVPSGKLSYTGRPEKIKKYKRLSEHLQPVIFERYTASRLVPWCRMHFAAEGVEASPEFLKAYVAYVSEEMSILDSEIKKLAAYVRANGRTSVTLEDAYLVSSSYEDFGIYDFANAILSGDRTKALRILRKKKEDREEPLYILSEISREVQSIITVKSMSEAGMSVPEIMKYTKLPEYPLKLRLEASRRFDDSTLRRLQSEIVKTDKNLKSVIGGYGGIERLVCLF